MISLLSFTPLQASAEADRLSKLHEKVLSLVKANLSSAEEEVKREKWYRALSLLDEVINANKSAAIEPEVMKKAYYLKTQALDALGEYQRAHESLNCYLEYTVSTDEEQWTWEKKLQYGQHFARGGRVRFLGLTFAPRIFRDYDLAHDILDSISTSATDRVILRQASLEKALLYRTQLQYSLCNAQLNELITMDPYSKEGMDAFVELGRSYMMEMSGRSCSGDLITYAEINRNRFEQYYPKADFVQMDAWIAQMKEEMAKSILEIARLYKKRGNDAACKLYTEKAKLEFPDTQIVKSAFSGKAQGK